MTDDRGLMTRSLACSPSAPLTNPASASNFAIGCVAGGTPSISSMSMPRGDSLPVRARSIEHARDGAASLRSLRLRLGQVGDELAIAARQVRREGAVDENDRGADRSRGPSSRLRGPDIRPRRYGAASPGRIHPGFSGDEWCAGLPRRPVHRSLGGGESAARREGGPLQGCAVGICRIGRREHRDFGIIGFLRSDRNRSRAPGKANCVAPRPATK